MKTAVRLKVFAAIGLSCVLCRPGLSQQFVLRPPRAMVPMGTFGPGTPPTGLNGYCPVILSLERKWVRGNSSYRAEYEGRTYFFAAEHLRERFLDNPARFAPVFSCMDVVQNAELGILAEGHRAHGVFYRNRVFLFVNETHLQKFWSNPEVYASPYIGGKRLADPLYGFAPATEHGRPDESQ